MTKRKKVEIETDVDQLAYCLTLLLAAVMPTLDKGETFELMSELLDQGVDEQTVKTYGRLVRATGFKVSSGVH